MHMARNLSFCELQKANSNCWFNGEKNVAKFLLKLTCLILLVDQIQYGLSSLIKLHNFLIVY